MDILNKIIKACFEGFFGTMIGGLVIYSLQSIRKNRRILLIVFVLLCGMGAWRFFIHNFYSPRYASIFLFPAILLTAFMMVKFKKWWWVLLIVFGIICCCKIVRVSQVGAFFNETATLLKADAAGRGKALIYMERADRKRMKYYSGIDTRGVPQFSSREKMTDYLWRMIRFDSKTVDVIYPCLEIYGDEPILKSELKRLKGEWTLLRSVSKNRKKKIYFHIYRYQKPLAADKQNDLKNKR
ncbi:MAG: hypothetical protein J6R86_03575 [Lentisphaeria bacterium]|nr:hypothetical protein [Lentisphaeria bacterium]